MIEKVYKFTQTDEKMVGVVTFPLEQKEFGTKLTVARNGLSFIFAVVIALVMGL